MEGRPAKPLLLTGNISKLLETPDQPGLERSLSGKI